MVGSGLFDAYQQFCLALTQCDQHHILLQLRQNCNKNWKILKAQKKTKPPPSLKNSVGKPVYKSKAPILSHGKDRKFLAPPLSQQFFLDLSGKKSSSKNIQTIERGAVLGYI